MFHSDFYTIFFVKLFQPVHTDLQILLRLPHYIRKSLHKYLFVFEQLTWKREKNRGFGTFVAVSGMDRLIQSTNKPNCIQNDKHWFESKTVWTTDIRDSANKINCQKLEDKHAKSFVCLFVFWCCLLCFFSIRLFQMLSQNRNQNVIFA